MFSRMRGGRTIGRSDDDLGRTLLHAVAERHPLVHAAAVGAFMAAAAGSALAQGSGRPITSAIVFLLGVTIAGALEGVWGGLIAALIASAAYNFFLIQPTFRFSLAGLEDYVPLIAFNAGAVAFGLLTGRLKDRALAADRARQRIGALLELSERLQAAVSVDDIPQAIQASAGSDGQLQFELYVSDGQKLRPLQHDARHTELASEAFAGRTAVSGPGRRGTYVLTSAEAPLGVLVVEWAEESGRCFGDEDLAALANLVGIAVERCLLLERLSQAELVRKSEEFKSALLSSVSHDMRTPLSAISASASSLARYGEELPEESKADMLNMIQEQCQRLNRYTTNLLNLGRLQAGLDRDRFMPCDAIEALGAAISQVRQLEGRHEIVKRIDVPAALVRADPVMLEQVFYNVLENSVRYSPPATPITVSARLRSSRLLISIRDMGRGIPVGEHKRIFERFHRVNDSVGSGEGTGVGLAIAKGFTEAFGGRIWAGVPEDSETGTVVTIELPVTDASKIS